MLRYIVSRVLLMIPLLAVVSLLAFLLSQGSPGNPVKNMLQQKTSLENAGDRIQTFERDEELRKIRKRLGLDLPLFYISISTLADIDTLYLVNPIECRPVLKNMARETGLPDSVMNWFYLQMSLSNQIRATLADTSKGLGTAQRENLNKALSLSEGIVKSNNHSDRLARQDTLANLLSLIPEVTSERSLFEKSLYIYRNAYENSRDFKKYIPYVQYFGTNNQYHRWLFGSNEGSEGFLMGDFGLSYRDGSPVQIHIRDGAKWTLLLTITALILAMLISIPIGLLAGSNPGGRFDKISSVLVFSLYALPGFFVASLLLMLFANPDFFDWFPSSGIKDPETFAPNASLSARIAHYLPYLILPVASLTYAQLAFISRQVKAGVVEAMQSDYVRAARAFGVPERQILLRHVLPNILFPLITMAGQSLPLLFGGSVIIESIFSIPGMGLEMYESVITLDYPMIVAIFTIIGFLTMLGYLISDILYAVADPRVRARITQNS